MVEYILPSHKYYFHLNWKILHLDEKGLKINIWDSLTILKEERKEENVLNDQQDLHNSPLFKKI